MFTLAGLAEAQIGLAIMGAGTQAVKAVRGRPSRALPADFNKDEWLDPLAFQGLIGASFTEGKYTKLFRDDGFAKSTAELLASNLGPRLDSYITNQGK